MSGIFQFAVRTQTELEAKMTCVERVTYYSNVSTNFNLILHDFTEIFSYWNITCLWMKLIDSNCLIHISFARKWSQISRVNFFLNFF